MAIKIILKDRSTKTVTYTVANSILELHRTKKYASEKQKDFMESVIAVQYSPDQVYCFHSYKLDKTIAMRTSNIYIYICANCNRKETVDNLIK